MQQETAITLPDGVHLAGFRPIAYFDKHMDCIRVFTHDRSVTEHRINKFFTLCENNFPSGPCDPQYIGFVIKGVKQLFSELGLPLDRTHQLADVIDRVVKHKPGSVMSITMQLILKEVSPGQLNIEVQQDNGFDKAA